MHCIGSEKPGGTAAAKGEQCGVCNATNEGERRRDGTLIFCGPRAIKPGRKVWNWITGKHLRHGGILTPRIRKEKLVWEKVFLAATKPTNAAYGEPWMSWQPFIARCIPHFFLPFSKNSIHSRPSADNVEFQLPARDGWDFNTLSISLLGFSTFYIPELLRIA